MKHSFPGQLEWVFLSCNIPTRLESKKRRILDGELVMTAEESMNMGLGYSSVTNPVCCCFPLHPT